MKKFTLGELSSLPTIMQSQFDDLKIQLPTKRVWLSRMTVEDGQPYNNMVTVEKLTSKYGIRPIIVQKVFWETIDTYEAL